MAVYSPHETDVTEWFPIEEMHMLDLHPGFRAWVEEHRLPRSEGTTGSPRP